MTGGPTLTAWRGVPFAPPAQLSGHGAQLERLSPRHGPSLYAANTPDPTLWRYMADGPFPSFEAYAAWLKDAASRADPFYYAIGDGTGWRGVAAYLRMDRANGVVEIGCIVLSPALQRTRAATEALHLMIAAAFDGGVRRVEWKCNAENAASRRAALRLGFTYEGTFRQHMVVKGRNRDTAWFALLDRDWPLIAAKHQAWLAPGNFDAQGRQRTALSSAG